VTLLIDEACIKRLITMGDALSAVEEVFKAQAEGGVVNVPRLRVPLKGGTLRVTTGVLSYRGYYGVKISSTAIFGSTAGRLFCLYKEASGQLVAIVQVFAMGAMRTGAASGIASKYMSNPESSVLGVVGSGRQAETQVKAICAVRSIRQIQVFSPNPDRCRDFCQRLESQIGIPLQAVESAERAVRGAHIVVSATASEKPVVLGHWLSPGVHINAIGANFEHRRELDREAVLAAQCIGADDIEQVRYESADLFDPVNAGLLDWTQVHALSEIVSGRVVARRKQTDVTLFKSLGVAMEDVALAARAYEMALSLQEGVQLPNLAG
jgi:ornithine cyclodeaminase/alanine dehydrogenase-like protein (mu-crystallin family)